jgi:hypothetical protein
MDQWTAKSTILLTEDHDLVRLSRGPHEGPTDANTGQHYQGFCEVIDRLATKLELAGDKTEEMIFSSSGLHAGCWRKHVKKHWSQQ